LDLVRDDVRDVKRDVGELKRDVGELKALVRFTNYVTLSLAGAVGTAALVGVKTFLHL
jgi:hypothetical protein